jgi:hypothetical protein
VKFPPLGTNKKGVVTYRKDLFLKEKIPQNCHISKGKKRKEKEKG